MRFRFIDLILFILLFIFVAAFPVDYIPVSYTYKLLILIGLRSLLLGYYIYIIIKNRVKIFGIANIKNLLLCTPFLLIGASNFIATWIDGEFIGITMEPLTFAFLSILTLITAITEEIIFRLIIHNALFLASSIKRIFASAGIFALLHLVNMFNVASIDALVTVLLQVAYTFGVGLLLGVFYEYSHSLTGAVVLHFAFNFFNQTLLTYVGGIPSNTSMYLTAIVISVVVGAYAALITFFIFRKYNRYYRA